MPPSPQSTLDPTNDEQSTPSQPPGSLTFYAFLAILGLFLFIFGALGFHSLIHRRRHRLMVEEAIRNGRWPPPPLVSKDVDLKKPGIWEIHLAGDATSGSRFVDAGGEKAGGRSGEDWYMHWDAIQPFSAAYVDPTRVFDPQGTNDRRTGSNVNFRQAAPPSTLPRPPLSRIRRILDLTSSSPSSLLPTPTNTTAPPTNNDNNNSTTITIPPEPSIIRIAVLITMPSQRPQSQSSSLSPSSTSHTLEPWHPDEEEELPYVNVGVAELPLLITDPGLEESKPKDSMGSSIDL